MQLLLCEIKVVDHYSLLNTTFLHARSHYTYLHFQNLLEVSYVRVTDHELAVRGQELLCVLVRSHDYLYDELCSLHSLLDKLRVSVCGKKGGGGFTRIRVGGPVGILHKVTKLAIG